MKKLSAGFTLIELLFVVAVLGVLSTTGVLFYQQRMQNQKVEKTVSQMQQWMQAGMAYYVKTGGWPQNADVLEKGGYIPAGAMNTSPWCGGPNSTEECYSVAPSDKPNLFAVTARELPSKVIADAIAARLPYTLDPTKDSVTGLVNVPLAALDKKTPDVILVGVRTFTLEPGAFEKFSVNPSSRSFATTKHNISGSYLGKRPSCKQYKGYDLRASAIVTSYSADLMGEQQPAFSRMQVLPRYDISGDVWIVIHARAQEASLASCGPFRPCITTDMSNSILDNLWVTGEVHFFCCKKGTPCQDLTPTPPPEPDTVTNSGGLSNGNTYSPDFRF